ncbi:MAG TPA: efflux RND transporter periplasmic adaptor subunit [Bryobacteraceae bacterium]|jgi:RND family efflux transporter MFP subunit|nr:efflux RND transporter periplasmic adaptor subunit [Bryobacteraceae bacterium]
MRPLNPNPSEPGDIDLAHSAEERLLRENEDLRRQLREQQTRAHSVSPTELWRPSGLTITVIVLGLTILTVAAFFAGYIPLRKRQALIQGEAQQFEQSLPRVEVIQVERPSQRSELVLPGNIEAVAEAPILARADGYIKRRLVDIGDRVRAGQPLAEIEAPELDDQVRQAKAAVDQSQAVLQQALANLDQGKANMGIAKVTADRWKQLSSQGVVSRQDNDNYQAQYQAQVANVQALEKAIAAQRSNIAAAEANVSRLNEMQGYRVVKAPFDGVITVRNVDAGALVTTGSTLLFRIAQTNTLRTYINVPQTNASSIRPGQPAHLSVTNRPGRTFAGTVTRTSNALDPNSRTLLVEVQVPNSDGALLPGMYAQVDFSSSREDPPVLIPSDTLIVRADGTQVAVVRPDHTVHMQKIAVGRDYGDRIEVLSGLHEGDSIMTNPGDTAREGVQVTPVATPKKP